MQNFTTFIGDSKTLTIPLEWEGAVFTPGASYTLIFTVKAELSDTDAQAKIQKVTGTGLTHSGSTALVALVPNDSTSLLEQSYFYDVQAQHNTTGAVLTVQNGKLRFKAGVTKELSSSIDIYTTDPPVPGGITIGTTTITNGTTTRILYNNAGVVGEYTISGTGSVAMTNSPTFVTPTLGAATATSINATTITNDGLGVLTFGSGTNSLQITFGSTGRLTLNGEIESFGAGKLTTNITGAKTLELVSANNYTATFTATGTVVMLDATQTLTNKTLVAPALGTPVSGTLTNCTGYGTGVTVTKATGVKTHYPPSADTDTARGLALEAAMAAAVAGDTIDLSPGSYYVGKATSTIAGLVAQYAILDKMTIRLNGAYLWKQSTDTASTMFNVSATSGVNDWSIIGPGTIEGSYADTSNTTGARGSAAAEIGINVAAARRWRIENVSIRNFAGTGLQLNSATFPNDEYTSTYKISTGHIHGCNIDLNNIGMLCAAGNEFVTFTNCTFNKNQTGCDIYAGNTRFVGCDADANANFALRIRNGGNDGHGCWMGGNIVHNAGFAISAEASMDNGFMFSGVAIAADSGTTNKIQSLGAGLVLTNCFLDAPFYASSTPTGINVLTDSYIVGTYTVITDLAAAERAKWKFKNNHTASGVWSNDDIRTTYADDTAAGTGGVLAGELWQSSATPGAVFVKL